MNHIDHYLANKSTFDYWIKQAVSGKPERLEISNDIFKPLIEPFRQANPTVNIFNCKDCVSDMLIWVKMEWEKYLYTPTAGEVKFLESEKGIEFKSKRKNNG